MKKLFVIVIAVLVLVVACGDSGEKEPVVEKKSEYLIGEVADVKGILISVNSVRYNEGDEFFNPDEGTKWINVDMTFENTTDKTEYIAGILDLTMKDGDGRSKDMNIWGDIDGSVDDDVMPDEKLTGEMSFTISEEDSELYVYYKPTFSSDEPIKFNISSFFSE